MIRGLSTLIAASSFLSMLGCTFVAVYPTLKPTAEGLQAYTDYEAVVHTDALEATVRIEGYNKVGIGFMGPIVPIVPVAAGTGRGEYLVIEIRLRPRGDSATFSPESVRVIVNGQTHAARYTTNPECGHFAGEHIDPNPPLELRGMKCLRFYFIAVPLPRDAFSLVAKELPNIDYVVTVGAQGHFVKQ